MERCRAGQCHDFTGPPRPGRPPAPGAGPSPPAAVGEADRRSRAAAGLGHPAISCRCRRTGEGRGGEGGLQSAHNRLLPGRFMAHRVRFMELRRSAGASSLGRADAREREREREREGERERERAGEEECKWHVHTMLRYRSRCLLRCPVTFNLGRHDATNTLF